MFSLLNSQVHCLQLPLEFFLCGIPNGTGAVRVKDLCQAGAGKVEKVRLLVILGSVRVVIGLIWFDGQLGTVQFYIVVHQDMYRMDVSDVSPSMRLSSKRLSWMSNTLAKNLAR